LPSNKFLEKSLSWELRVEIYIPLPVKCPSLFTDSNRTGRYYVSVFRSRYECSWNSYSAKWCAAKNL